MINAPPKRLHFARIIIIRRIGAVSIGSSHGRARALIIPDFLLVLAYGCKRVFCLSGCDKCAQRFSCRLVRHPMGGTVKNGRG